MGNLAPPRSAALRLWRRSLMRSRWTRLISRFTARSLTREFSSSSLTFRNRFRTYRNRWRRCTCVDMAAGPATAESNGRRRRAARTVGRHEGWRRSRAGARCYQRRRRARRETASRRPTNPSMSSRLRSLPQPCTVAVGDAIKWDSLMRVMRCNLEPCGLPRRGAFALNCSLSWIMMHSTPLGHGAWPKFPSRAQKRLAQLHNASRSADIWYLDGNGFLKAAFESFRMQI